MLENLIYFQILGKPLIMYFGILTLLSFLFTASIAVLNQKGIHLIPFVWHPRMAIISITLAIMHGTFGILAYF
ncbi:MAG TPA: hypothetical protein VJB35_01965 [Candidatus Nanoarchaeia archaeon]|nr:hypothetical protein [Candidatus Nanoarchaeia archaeon]